MVNMLTLSLFPLLLVAAGIGDMLTMRIPNWLNGAIIAAFFVMALLAGMPFEVMKWHLAAGGLLLVAGMALFFFGGFGGGDAKMIAAAGLWVGWSALVPYLVFTALAGGVLALIMIIWSNLRIEQELRDAPWMKRVFGRDLDLPYGVAIATGALLAFPSTWWMQGLV